MRFRYHCVRFSFSQHIWTCYPSLLVALRARFIFFKVEVQFPGNTMTRARTKPIRDRWRLQISHLAKVLIFQVTHNSWKNREYFSSSLPGVKVICLLLTLCICMFTLKNFRHCLYNCIIKGRREKKGTAEFYYIYCLKSLFTVLSISVKSPALQNEMTYARKYWYLATALKFEHRISTLLFNIYSSLFSHR